MMKTIRYSSCLLIENDPEDQEIFMSALHDIAPEVGCYAVSDRYEAMALLSTNIFIPEIVFAVVEMSGNDGFDFLKSYPKSPIFQSIPIFALSSTSSQSLLDALKPYNVQALYVKQRLDVMKQILEKHFIIENSPALI